MEALRTQIVNTIQAVRCQVRWRPGKDHQHLEKRIRQGHLPPSMTIASYSVIVLAIVSHPDALVYVYRYGAIDYPTIVAPYEGRTWLAMFSPDGVMETAFPPDKPNTYFINDPRYISLGSLKEILS